MIEKIKNIILQKEYQNSIKNPEQFWEKQIKNITWMKIPTKINTSNFNTPKISWFENGRLNVTQNCIDIHAKKTPNKIAIIWENDNLTKTKKITYKQLQSRVNELANILKNNKIKKGDVVIIYMSLIPEAVYSMLACAKIGAIHSVVFGGFSGAALKQRIDNSKAKLIITANQGIRAGKKIPLKDNVNQAVKETKNYKSPIKNILIVNRTPNKCTPNKKDIFYEDELKKVIDKCRPTVMDSTDPLFILYTSGSTGQPKGLVHSTGGYLTYAKTTFKRIFNYQKNQIFWCTADIGWITGHTYLVYGPLSNGATIVMHEGTPLYPNYGVHGQLIDKHKVNIYYTAPTAIRAVMKKEKEALNLSKRTSLKLLGSVGEPLNKSAYNWYNNKFGNNKCKIVDTWWQTETGGIILTPQYYNHKKQPGFVGKPFFGIQVIIKNEKGETLKNNEEGNLCIEKSWPGQAMTIFGDHKRFKETYFSKYKNTYLSGDGAYYDKDKNFQIIGRIDDVINVSGHRMGSAELESDLNTNKNVLESAVIGIPDKLTGEKILAFIILKTKPKSKNKQEELKQDIQDHIKQQIGSFAKPKKIVFVKDLPKTRSGKIMRRLLKKIATNNKNLGDTSTLLDPKVLDDIKKDLSEK